MNKPLVIGFVAQNDYGVLQDSSAGIGYYFAERGYESATINLYDSDSLKKLQQFIVQSPIAFGYGYAGIGAHLEVEGKSLWQKLKIPFFSLLHDHPFYYPAHHSVNSDYVCNCYAIKDFVDIQKTYIKSKQPIAELRVASVGYADPKCDNWNRYEWHERDILGCFIKAGYNFGPLLASFDVMPDFYRTIVWDSINTLKSNSNLSIADMVHDQMLVLGLHYNQDVKIWEDFTYLVRVIDTYVRNWRSLQLVESLKHLPIVIIGNDWDSIDKTNAKATFLPAMSTSIATQYSYRAKFALNTHPYARYGWHERVLNGLSFGSAVISDRTFFTDQHFSDLPNFLSFDWSSENFVPILEGKILEIEKNAFDVMPVRARLAEHFDPFATVDQMIGMAGNIRDRMAG